LMFADNLMVFCAAKLKSAQCLMRAFHEFSKTIGLVTNYSKSEIVIRVVTHKESRS